MVGIEGSDRAFPSPRTFGRRHQIFSAEDASFRVDRHLFVLSAPVAFQLGGWRVCRIWGIFLLVLYRICRVGLEGHYTWVGLTCSSAGHILWGDTHCHRPAGRLRRSDL